MVAEGGQGAGGSFAAGFAHTRVEANRLIPYTSLLALPGWLQDRGMDLNLQRPRGCCTRTGRSFAPGEVVYTALLRSKAGWERADFSSEGWTGPPTESVAWWRSLHAPPEVAGTSLTPPDVLLDIFEQLAGQPEGAALRYLLMLQLVRRKVLKTIEQPDSAGRQEEVRLACRRRDSEYSVRVPTAEELAVAGLEEKLSALLWAGGEP